MPCRWVQAVLVLQWLARPSAAVALAVPRYNLSASSTVPTDLYHQWSTFPSSEEAGWLGGDADVSVMIGGGPTGRRELWIFADSFIAKYDAKTRTRVWEGAQIASSTVGIVDCSESSCSGRPRFYWKTSDSGTNGTAGSNGTAKVRPFFEAEHQPEATVWPVSALASRDGDSVFILAETMSGDLLDLNVSGTMAICIQGVSTIEDPREWKYTTYDVGSYEYTWFSGIFYQSHDGEGDQVYILGHRHTEEQREMQRRARLEVHQDYLITSPTATSHHDAGLNSTSPKLLAISRRTQLSQHGKKFSTQKRLLLAKAARQRIMSDHTGRLWSGTMLAKASFADLMANRWSRVNYWTDLGWQPEITEQYPLKTIDLPSWETTVTWSQELGLWYSFHIEGWSYQELTGSIAVKPVITMRTAARVTGQWSALKVFEIPQAFWGVLTEKWVCYAAKAHPELVDHQESPGEASLYIDERPGHHKPHFHWPFQNSSGHRPAVRRHEGYPTHHPVRTPPHVQPHDSSATPATPPQPSPTERFRRGSADREAGAKPAPAPAPPAIASASADVVFSWICNSWDTTETGVTYMRKQLFAKGRMFNALRGYWPRFVRLHVERFDSPER